MKPSASPSQKLWPAIAFQSFQIFNALIEVSSPCGYVVDPDNKSEIIELIKSLISKENEGFRKKIVDNYDISIRESRLIEEIEDMFPDAWLGHSNTPVKIGSGLFLDIGSGHSPNSRADILLDNDISEDSHRSGKAIVILKEREFILGDANFLPFADKSIDYISASHIAEHVDDPVIFCNELMRVGKAGYLETPSWAFETLVGEPKHKWKLIRNKGTLIFKRKSNHILSELGHAIYYSGRERIGEKIPNLPKYFSKVGIILRGVVRRLPKDFVYTRFQWKDEFQIKIE